MFGKGIIESVFSYRVSDFDAVMCTLFVVVTFIWSWVIQDLGQLGGILLIVVEVCAGGHNVFDQVVQLGSLLDPVIRHILYIAVHMVYTPK